MIGKPHSVAAAPRCGVADVKEQHMEQQGVRQRRTPPATLEPMLGTARLRAGLGAGSAHGWRASPTCS